MKRIVQIFSILGILLTILPSVFFFIGKISHSTQNLWMLIGAVVWFASASFWLGSQGNVKNG